MKVVNDGHVYRLENLGGVDEQALIFIKRSGGAITYEEEWPGLQVQEVLRVLIDRTKYLYNILPCLETQVALKNLRMSLYWYEVRAYRRKKEKLNKTEGLHNDLDTIYNQYASDFPITEVDIENRDIGEDGHIIL